MILATMGLKTMDNAITDISINHLMSSDSKPATFMIPQATEMVTVPAVVMAKTKNNIMYEL